MKNSSIALWLSIAWLVIAVFIFSFTDGNIEVSIVISSIFFATHLILLQLEENK